MAFLYGVNVNTDFDREKKVLENLLSPPNCRGQSSGMSSINCDFADPLDSIRQNAREEFVRNGIEVELDDLDVYQYRLREGQPASPPSASSSSSTSWENAAFESSSPPGHSAALDEYLEMRRQKRKKKIVKNWCVFCKNNGEMKEWFESHTLKDNLGRTTCPILRRYVCPRCGKSGDSAHTIRYCPRNEGELTPAVSQLLKTDRLASGRLRFNMKC